VVHKSVWIKTRKERTISLEFMQKWSRKHCINEGRCNTETGFHWTKIIVYRRKSSILYNIRHIDITYEEFPDIFAALGTLN
jgi:hypothetical protein